MRKPPIDLERLREADALADALLARFPALRAPNPDRERALADWLTEHLHDKDDTHGEDRQTSDVS